MVGLSVRFWLVMTADGDTFTIVLFIRTAVAKA
jgi:hypothetical protein